jgi:hypothetical protein
VAPTRTPPATIRIAAKIRRGPIISARLSTSARDRDGEQRLGRAQRRDHDDPAVVEGDEERGVGETERQAGERERAQRPKQLPAVSARQRDGGRHRRGRGERGCGCDERIGIAVGRRPADDVVATGEQASAGERECEAERLEVARSGLLSREHNAARHDQHGRHGEARLERLVEQRDRE